MNVTSFIRSEALTKNIGGYNPQSWDASDPAKSVIHPADRTAFVFNLSDNVIFRQNKLEDALFGDEGQFQTNSSLDLGPAFYSNLVTESEFTRGDSSLVGYTSDGPVWNAFNKFSGLVTHNFTESDDFFINKLEVFAISNTVPTSPVPEPETYAMMVGGLG